MKRTAVRSSQIRSAGYEEDSKTLEVEFHSGGVYQYANVPKATYDALMSAPSAGSFLARNIKGRFSYKRVR